MSTTRGEWLTRQMERRDISVRQLADALDVTTQTVYGWQHDKAVVSEERVPRLASVLGISEMEARKSLGYWVPDSGEEPPPELDKDQLREILRRSREVTADLERLLGDQS